MTFDQLRNRASLNERSLMIGLALLFAVPAMYLLAHPYLGIHHDGVYYAFYALQHISPKIFSGDFFVRIVSQDSYTIFSLPYAELVRWIGIERAAHVVARISSISVCIAAGVLARRLMDRELSWLAIALFIMIPGFYGARLVFSYGEDFATPRPLTEALVLSSFALLLRARTYGAGISALTAMSLHPLMAMPGLLTAVLMSVRARIGLVLGVLAGVVTVSVALIASYKPVGLIQLIDPEWHRALQLLHYLIADEWTIVDWQPNGVALITLALATLILPRDASWRLALNVLIVSVAGVMLTVFASFVVPVAAVIAGQPWRWLWIGKALAVLLLPVIGRHLCARGWSGVGAAVLLALAWIGSFEPVAIPAALLALLAILLHDRGRELSRHAGWIAWLPVVPFSFAVLRLMGTMTVQLVIAAVMIPIWWLLFRAPWRWSRIAIVLVALVFFIFESASTYSGSKRALDTYPVYDTALWSAFAPWRAQIGEQQTVLFIARPEMVWLTLERRSYQPYTPVVFSRAAAMATLGRLESLGFYVDESRYSTDLAAREPSLSLSMLKRICGVPEIDFVVSGHALRAPHMLSHAPRPFDGLSLYRCSELLDH
jgi:hypothetical protein